MALMSGRMPLYCRARPGHGLTPHPGPLPFEGRGGATDAPVGWKVASRVRVSMEERRQNAALPFEPPSRSAATPSPLNGERAGVRGEAVR